MQTTNLNNAPISTGTILTYSGDNRENQPGTFVVIDLTPPSKYGLAVVTCMELFAEKPRVLAPYLRDIHSTPDDTAHHWCATEQGDMVAWVANLRDGGYIDDGAC